ncbi:glycoside hydrolase family 30 protein [Clostridium folliculivorans]|uniref:Glycosyl hydrolase n=1 Tax=Clostridium folliculivorans TaxID=2886038 RepID=A0A9W6DBC9_9CLOT|nr:glycoside hydrolase family 30 protein [Clostridium folliculivorans]GKU26295.1 glycosyl hydrolase [Clostridium folliculivorans]GKU31967.1 glycosyl hydrolase [Clostridium folliculivorans]
MGKIRIIQTAKDTADRLTEKDSISFNKEKSSDNTLKIDRNKKYQKIVGFGGAFTESAAYTLARMDEEKREEIVKKYFDQVDGLAYSIGRVHIHSCDFSLGNYTYVEENDVELKTFDISHEKQWVLPFIDAARKTRNGEILLLASPWSPPGWMKSNGEMNHGGTLLPEYYEAWANYYAKYIKAMRKEGFDIWAITVQNEPAALQVWDSCLYSAEEERDFLKNHLGPTLEREGLSDVKIYIWDHNRDILFERADTVLSDPEAAKYVYGTGNHWYVSEEFENLSKLHDKYPDKHILFTEGCQEGGLHLGSWLTGERYGRNMIGDFRNWQEGWIDWNLILDETGGPNHVGNLCDAPIVADTKAQEIHYNSSYYYIGHFSKYVKPGAVRIDSAIEGASNLEQVAFLNEDGSVVLIVMNESDNTESFDIEADGQYANYVLEAHSIATFIL